MPKLPVPENWDRNTDVLIIGGGTAGLPAGIAVTEAGYRATVLEMTASTGGSGKMIGVGASFATGGAIGAGPGPGGRPQAARNKIPTKSKVVYKYLDQG